jgi:hypothetical protein
MIENRKVKLALTRFQSVPGDRHQDGIDVGTREARQDANRLRRGASRRIAELTAKNEERPAIHYQLRRAGFAI